MMSNVDIHLDTNAPIVMLEPLVVPRDGRREGRATRLAHAPRAQFPDRALRIVPIVPDGCSASFPRASVQSSIPMAQVELVREL